MAASHVPRTERRPRRGVTLIVIALLIVVLVGMVGLVLDFGRFYVYRVQMQTTTDAAALAGVQELARNSPATAVDSALDYVGLNQVDGGTASVPRSAVRPGIWRFSSATFAPAASFSTAGVNAVRVTATHSAVYTFGRVWQTANINLQTRATAALGFVHTTPCLKPWAVDYQDLLDELYPPAGSKPVTYDLTPADITTLSQMGPANQIDLIADTTSPVTPGNVGSIQVSAPWNGASYSAAIDGPCPNLWIGAGSTVAIDPGQGKGRTKSPLLAFCNANGGTSGNPNSFTCLDAPKVKIAIWDTNNGQSGNNLKYHVKYVGAFAVMAFDGSSEQLTGYFTTMASLGAVGPTPSPIIEGILVQ